MVEELRIDNICVPIEISCFALSPPCCDSKSVRIAPITQPNYVGLRLDESLVQHDVLEHCDLHLTCPHESNVRVTDLGTDPPELRMNRLGVYVHWSLPRCYRSATQFADSRSQDTADDTTGRPNSDLSERAQPVYPKVPNRWLVVRRLLAAEPAGKIPDFQSWVVESDRLRRINEIPFEDDLETDATPFVAYDSNQRDGVLMTQAEVFIGMKHRHSGWGRSVGWQEGADQTAKFVDLTIMNSANPLFPDYVPHNQSVFSIVDSFEYTETGVTETQHLVKAKADYIVLGWHAKAADGPLTTSRGKLQKRLSKLFMEPRPNPVSSTDPADPVDPVVVRTIEDMLDLPNSVDVLLHGAIYDVNYDQTSKPDKTLAEEAAVKLNPETIIEPVSIGTTPLDAVMTFLEAHGTDIEQVFGPESLNVSSDILRLASLLYAADDSYDSRVRAQDLLYTNNWTSSSAGFVWKFNATSQPGKGPLTPTSQELKALEKLNILQSKSDSLSRTLQQNRWDLFALWFKFISDKSNYVRNEVEAYRAEIGRLKEKIKSLQQEVNDVIRPQIEALSGTVNGTAVPNGTPEVICKRVPEPTYFVKKDPTLCIAGLLSGFPEDFLDDVPIRFEFQLPTSTDGVDAIFRNSMNPVRSDTGLNGTAARVLSECLNSRPADAKNLRKGFKAWNNTNPFEPMFIEWEALYYQIERTKWEVGVRAMPFGDASSQVRFAVDGELLSKDENNQKDYRWVTGRVMILPQPVFSLSTIVEQVLTNTPSTELPPELVDDKNRKALLDKVKKLQFISAPLDGLTQHLLTRYVGTHVSPNIRTQGKNVIPLEDAVIASEPVDFGDEGMLLMDGYTNYTPYGNLQPFDPRVYTGVPFKGMTHGQMMITKLNIIDKFGQAICALPPVPTSRVDQLPTTPPPAIFPCISSFLSPDTVRVVEGSNARYILNTIHGEPEQLQEGEWPRSRFIQLTPGINQDTRLNAAFVSRNPTATSYPFWHETNDDLPETPVFGWIVINYQDYGLQFFLPDGTFYREVRVGGPTGTNAGAKWLPFDPPREGTVMGTGTQQLDELIAKFVNIEDEQGDFLRDFFEMINGALKSTPFPPSDYSAYASSLVGKPLALVNVGWSLELATPALEAQNTLGNRPPDVAAEMASYKFPLKIGSKTRPFDGVVGYFMSDNSNDGRTDWSKLYTYWGPLVPSRPNLPPSVPRVEVIEPANFPIVSPTYIDATKDGFSVAGITNPRAYTNYIEARTAQYVITTMLIDPYTPLHAYSPILPIKSIQLPPWTLQKAFLRMTAFFRLGPNLLTKDVPSRYDATRPLDPETWLKTQQVTSNPPNLNPQNPLEPPPPEGTVGTVPAPAPVPAVRLPISGNKGLWKWLQPYDVPKEGATDPTETVTRYNSLKVDEEDARIRLDPPPYTFVEGYLQLARPLLQEDVGRRVPGI